MKATVTCLALWLTAFLTHAAEENVCLITVNGPIGPATAGYISRSIDEAQSRGAQCLVIQLNTPGGLLGRRVCGSYRRLCNERGLFYHACGERGRDGPRDHYWCRTPGDDRRKYANRGGSETG
jgi:hypothetical protein